MRHSGTGDNAHAFYLYVDNDSTLPSRIQNANNITEQKCIEMRRRGMQRRSVIKVGGHQNSTNFAMDEKASRIALKGNIAKDHSIRNIKDNMDEFSAAVGANPTREAFCHVVWSPIEANTTPGSLVDYSIKVEQIALMFQRNVVVDV